MELLRCPTTPGGTAAPDPRQFQLTTDWLARRLLGKLEPYDFGAGRLRFRPMPRGPRDQGAELVSQALGHEGSRGTEWFSVVLNITLQTVPFDPLPRFHLHTHIRRYATRVGVKSGRLYLPYGRRSTVLLRPRVPWLPGAPASDRFALARLGWNKGGHDWVGGGPAGMLRSMSLTESFPDAESVLTAPAEWLEDGMRAAVVHSTAMGSHEVGTGLMPDQRSRIVEWAEEALPEQLRPAPALVRTRLSGSTPANPRREPSEAAKKAVEERQRTEARRQGAAFALRCLAPDADPGELPLLEAGVFWQTPDMRDTAVAALIAHLDLKGDGGAPEDAGAFDGTVVLEWQTPELTVRLRCRKLTRSLGHDLTLPEGSRHSREVVTAALGARRREMADFVSEDGPVSLPSLALVEIDRARDFTSPTTTPSSLCGSVARTPVSSPSSWPSRKRPRATTARRARTSARPRPGTTVFGSSAYGSIPSTVSASGSPRGCGTRPYGWSARTVAAVRAGPGTCRSRCSSPRRCPDRAWHGWRAGTTRRGPGCRIR